MTATILRGGLVALALFLAASTVSIAWAAAQDYRFEVVGPAAKSGKATVIKVRLVRIPDGKPVPDAVIACCAVVYNCGLLHADRHFERISQSMALKIYRPA